VPNPPHHPQGDFALSPTGRVQRREAAEAGARALTYSTIGLFRPAMVQHLPVGEKAALRPCLDRAIDAGRLSGQLLEGPWVDVGTPQRLAELNQAPA
jgi:MurNAc alpha-1-phosphate uridylyltransferase